MRHAGDLDRVIEAGGEFHRDVQLVAELSDMVMRSAQRLLR